MIGFGIIGVVALLAACYKSIINGVDTALTEMMLGIVLFAGVPGVVGLLVMTFVGGGLFGFWLAAGTTLALIAWRIIH